MNSSLDRWLVERIFDAIGPAPVRIVIAGEEFRPPRVDPQFTVSFRDRKTLFQVLRDPEIGFSEAYAAGTVRVDGGFVEFLVRVYQTMKEPRWSARAPSKWMEFVQDNSPRRARQNMHRHYDLGNDFHNLWLDSQLITPAPIFPTLQSRWNRRRSPRWSTSSGACLVDGAALDRDGDTWIANGSIRTRIVIGAGGHFCPVARKMGATPTDAVAAQESEFEMTADQISRCDVRGDTPELYFSPDLLGYGWCFRKDDVLNVGLDRADSHWLSKHVREFVRWKIPFQTPAPHGHAYFLYGSSREKFSATDGCRSATRRGSPIRSAEKESCPPSNPD